MSAPRSSRSGFLSTVGDLYGDGRRKGLDVIAVASRNGTVLPIGRSRSVSSGRGLAGLGLDAMS